MQVNSTVLFALFGVPLLVKGMPSVSKETTEKPQEIQVLQAIYNDVERIKNRSVIVLPRAECFECYGELDCFDLCKGVFSYVNELPDSPEEISTRFTLYSRRNESEGVDFTYTDVTPAARFLDAPRKVVFLVHGFNSGASSTWMTELRANILEAEDVIVITVDWSGGCLVTAGYARAVVNSELVGRQIAVALHKLKEISPQNVRPERTHLIGHSLGAQIGKFFSVYFRKLSDNALIGRITALDAAAPLFEAFNVCLNSSDAIFIDAIHTSAGDDILRGKLGVTRQVGHIDIYVNGGSEQPGCALLDMNCSHRRAHVYYRESFKSDVPCIFRSYACVGGLVEYREGKCRKEMDLYNAIKFEGSQSMPGRGVGFVDTRSSSPFCK